jgi:20S proteasome subunit beta 1
LNDVGIYISNRASDKMCNLTDNVVMARSGSAADTEAVAGFVRHHAASHAIELGKEANVLEVKTVARILNKINYENKGANGGQGLGCYAICAGYDEREGAQVFSCTAGGNMVQTPWTTDGSGSTYIWGFLDSEFKENFTRDECEKYVLKALTLAMAVDSSSGGCARLCTVNKDGCFRKFVKGDELERQLGEIHFKSGAGLGKGVVYGDRSGGLAI